MSISTQFFERLKERKNPKEIYYYAQRCLFNADIVEANEENFLDQAHRLSDLLEQIARGMI